MSHTTKGEVLQPGCYVRQSELLKALPFSSATLWRKVADGTFPKPIKLGPRITAWDANGVRRWMAEREAA